MGEERPRTRIDIRGEDGRVRIVGSVDALNHFADALRQAAEYGTAAVELRSTGHEITIYREQS